jgi:hypothetical protein
MSQFPQYNVNNEHQLIRRQNTFVVDRKLVTIHSEDRDIKKWPNANHFEIDLPETLTNVQSMRLVEIELPANQYVFSNNHQNTKLEFYITPQVSTDMVEYLALVANIGKPFSITIQEGFFTPEQIALATQNLMNQAVETFLQTTIPGATYDRFKVYYDTVGQQMWFGNTYDDFIFAFTQKIPYDISCSAIVNQQQPPNVWDQYTKWGLPSYLGFNKENYTATETNTDIKFNYNNYIWLKPDETILPFGVTKHAFYIKGPNTICMFGDTAIYMEMNKYNTMDELVPYSEATNNMYNNDYNGSVNAAFAKIPVTINPNGQIFDSRNGFLQNVSQYHPPIDKLRKVKFRFRYHDGRLVEFKDCNFNFTLSFNQLRDEIARDYIIRVPAEYNL